MKKVLVIYYSQSGQGKQIVENVLQDLSSYPDIRIDYKAIEPVPPYQFPWRDISFWDAMPECVKLIPGKIKPLQTDKNEDYDLIVLEYPIWFLSPPIPLTTFLKSDDGTKILNGKPVITVIGARNMWVNAQEDVKKMIKDAGGKLAGNIVLHDRHQNIISVVTIIYWMLTAKKERFLGIFPKPGISDKDIDEAVRFGPVIRDALLKNDFAGLQQKLLKLNAVEFKPDVVQTELTAKKIFHKFAAFILKKGGPGDRRRYGRLKLFKYYLLFAILFVSPLVSLVFYILYPFRKKAFNKKLRYFESVTLEEKGN